LYKGKISVGNITENAPDLKEINFVHKIISTSIFSEKISPANDGLFVLDG